MYPQHFPFEVVSTQDPSLRRRYPASSVLWSIWLPDRLRSVLAITLVRRYSLPSENRQDLPRLPIYFYDMPCSQTPGMPHTSALSVVCDSVFWFIYTIDHSKSRT